MSNKVIRRVCFTLHDYTFHDYGRLDGLFHNGLVRYIIYGREVCPTTGRRHLQGYLNLVKPTKFNTVKAYVGESAHLEVAGGSDADSRRYCSKDGDFVELGNPVTQGQRSDLEGAVECLKQHGLKRMAEEHPACFIRHHRGLQAYRALVLPAVHRDFKTELRVYVGRPGVGKSRLALESAREYCTPGTGEPLTELDVYYKPRGDWWDGYQQQPVVIIDDFYGWLKYDELLKISDRYPYRVPVKGGFEIFNSKVIYITSNAFINVWYKFVGFEPTALYRRCTEYCELTLVDEQPVKRDIDVPINF